TEARECGPQGGLSATAPRPVSRRETSMSLVMLGVDPHKQSHTATALVTGSHQHPATLRVPARPPGYGQLLAWARQFPQRRWAIENARGLGCHLTRWLLAHGETVQDVPTTPTPRARQLPRGCGAKT